METNNMTMQPNVIVFASQKGGSGKTTLSGHIAVQAQLAGAGPVAIVDTDPQRSLTQWHEARNDDSLILRVSDVENIERDIAELKNLGAATIVVDTPPAATAAIGEVVSHADLVCIPARPSPHDLRAVGATIDIVEARNRPMVFVLNGAAARAKITSEAAMALSQHGTVAPAIIHNRVDFASSMTDGRTVVEVAEGSRSAGEIEVLWDYIAVRLDKLHKGRSLMNPWGPAARQVDSVPHQETPSESPWRLLPAQPALPAQPSPHRPIVETPTFFGPDRRRVDKGAPTGSERRVNVFGRRVRDEMVA